jgi:hypothetical protein
MSEEIYSFTARVVGRVKRRISISPENPDAFMDYLERQGLPLGRYRPKGMCLISISNPKLIEVADGANRVRYSVKRLGRRLIGVKLEPVF